MARTDAEKSSYGAFERILFYVTPIIFTVALLGVLFALFDMQPMNALLRAANKVPVLERFVPDPVVQEDAAATGGSVDKPTTEGQAENAEAIARLESQLAGTEAELNALQSEIEQKDTTILELQEQVSILEAQLERRTQTDEQYGEQIRQLASIYTNMSSSRAAPILQSMTLAERVLVMSEMTPDARGAVLARMNPQVAAETSIQMKDAVPAKDLQIAALQERLDVQRDDGAQTAATVTHGDLGQTFARMTPKSAAAILIEMNKANQNRVLDILRVMDNDSRARVISAISDVSSQTAATLTAGLRP